MNFKHSVMLTRGVTYVETMSVCLSTHFVRFPLNSVLGFFEKWLAFLSFFPTLLSVN